MLRTEAPKRDLEYRQRLARLLAGQKRILETIVREEPSASTLDAITSLIEAQDGSLICSIMAVNDDGQTLSCVSRGSLPAEYADALARIPIGPDQGCCGTAAYLKQRIITSDIATDPKWQPVADLATRNGLRACWSQPVMDSDGNVLGTFAIYYPHPGSPSDQHFELIDLATHLVEICLQGARARHRRQQSVRRAMIALTDLKSQPGLSPDIHSRLASIESELSSA